MRRDLRQALQLLQQGLDAVLTKADVELDPAARLKLYEQASNMLIDDIPGPFLYNATGIFLVKPNVTGYTTTAADVQWPGQWGSMLTVDVTR